MMTLLDYGFKWLWIERQKGMVYKNKEWIYMAEKKKKKYLNISIGGAKGFQIRVFENENKKSDNEPDYTGSIQLACWENEVRDSGDK